MTTCAHIYFQYITTYQLHIFKHAQHTKTSTSPTKICPKFAVPQPPKGGSMPALNGSSKGKLEQMPLETMDLAWNFTTTGQLGTI